MKTISPRLLSPYDSTNHRTFSSTRASSGSNKLTSASNFPDIQPGFAIRPETPATVQTQGYEQDNIQDISNLMFDDEDSLLDALPENLQEFPVPPLTPQVQQSDQEDIPLSMPDDETSVPSLFFDNLLANWNGSICEELPSERSPFEQLHSGSKQPQKPATKGQSQFHQKLQTQTYDNNSSPIPELMVYRPESTSDQRIPAPKTINKALWESCPQPQLTPQAQQSNQEDIAISMPDPLFLDTLLKNCAGPPPSDAQQPKMQQEKTTQNKEKNTDESFSHQDLSPEQIHLIQQEIQRKKHERHINYALRLRTHYPYLTFHHLGQLCGVQDSYLRTHPSFKVLPEQLLQIKKEIIKDKNETKKNYVFRIKAKKPELGFKQCCLLAGIREQHVPIAMPNLVSTPTNNHEVLHFQYRFNILNKPKALKLINIRQDTPKEIHETKTAYAYRLQSKMPELDLEELAFVSGTLVRNLRKSKHFKPISK